MEGWGLAGWLVASSVCVNVLNEQLNRVCKWRFGVWLVGWLVASSVCMIVSNEQLNRVCKWRAGV